MRDKGKDGRESGRWRDRKRRDLREDTERMKCLITTGFVRGLR